MYPKLKKKFTEQDYVEIKKMASIGMRNEEIANIKSLTIEALKYHFQSELSQGRRDAIPKVAETAYEMATNGKCPAMTMFWLKARAGWREQIDLDEVLEMVNKKIDEAIKSVQKENSNEVITIGTVNHKEENINRAV